MIYGYARVSSGGQSYEAQRDALRAAGATTILAEKISAATAERPQLKRLLKLLHPGDSVIVTALDRLARNSRDLLNIVHQITDEKAELRSLRTGEEWISHRDPRFAKLMLSIVGGIAEFERSLIKDRTSAGRQRARKAGVKFGPKFKLDDYQRAEAVKRRDAGEPYAVIARTYKVSKSTISRLKRD